MASRLDLAGPEPERCRMKGKETKKNERGSRKKGRAIAEICHASHEKSASPAITRKRKKQIIRKRGKGKRGGGKMDAEEWEKAEETTEEVEEKRNETLSGS